MVIDYEFNRTMRELSKIIPSIDSLDYRRLTYLIIETRRAAYRAASIKRTLGDLLLDFGISDDTYYDWRMKWHRYLPDYIKKLAYRSFCRLVETHPKYIIIGV